MGIGFRDLKLSYYRIHFRKLNGKSEDVDINANPVFHAVDQFVWDGFNIAAPSDASNLVGKSLDSSWYIKRKEVLGPYVYRPKFLGVYSDSRLTFKYYIKIKVKEF